MPKPSVEERFKSFVEKSNRVHEFKFDYSEADFIDATKKIKITCKVCRTTFMQVPGSHAYGRGCKTCGIARRASAKRKTTEQFVKEAIEVHGDRYTYGESLYTGIKDQVKIGCKVHGIFSQMAGEHLKGSGCNKCGYLVSGGKGRLKFDEVIQRAKIVHKEDQYTYHKVERSGGITYLHYTCNTCHGENEQRVADHLEGHGCNTCGYVESGLKQVGYINNTIVERNKEEYLEIPNNVYLIKLLEMSNEDGDAYKIGFSKDISHRSYMIGKDFGEYEVVAIKSSDLYNAFKIEQRLHKEYKDKNIIITEKDLPCGRRKAGITEIFRLSESDINRIKGVFEGSLKLEG